MSQAKKRILEKVGETRGRRRARQGGWASVIFVSGEMDALRSLAQTGRLAVRPLFRFDAKLQRRQRRKGSSKREFKTVDEAWLMERHFPCLSLRPLPPSRLCVSKWGGRPATIVHPRACATIRRFSRAMVGRRWSKKPHAKAQRRKGPKAERPHRSLVTAPLRLCVSQCLAPGGTLWFCYRDPQPRGRDAYPHLRGILLVIRWWVGVQ